MTATNTPLNLIVSIDGEQFESKCKIALTPRQVSIIEHASGIAAGDPTAESTRCYLAVDAAETFITTPTEAFQAAHKRPRNKA